MLPRFGRLIFPLFDIIITDDKISLWWCKKEQKKVWLEKKTDVKKGELIVVKDSRESADALENAGCDLLRLDNASIQAPRG